MADRVIYRKDTPYQRLTVAENAAKNQRYLYTSRRDEKQGGIYLSDPLKLYFEYCKVSLVALSFLGYEPGSALFVGLGAGSLPRYLSSYYPKAAIDVVEVDGEVFDVASKFFYFSETENMKVRVEDGRSFLRKTSRKYDIVFLDAYQVRAIPYHLSTVEFLEEVRQRLSEHGVVVANIVGQEQNRAFNAMLATYERVYRNIYVFEGITSYNNVIVAAPAPVDRKAVHERSRRIQKERKMDVKLHRLATRPFYSPRPRPGVRVLTDESISAMK
jgi:spermidine synthase